MVEAHVLLAEAARLHHEARELEAKEVVEKDLAKAWDDEVDNTFITMAEAQIERDWHLHNADTNRKRARKLRRNADRLRRKAERRQRRDGLI